MQCRVKQRQMESKTNNKPKLYKHKSMPQASFKMTMEMSVYRIN